MEVCLWGLFTTTVSGVLSVFSALLHWQIELSVLWTFSVLVMSLWTQFRESKLPNIPRKQVIEAPKEDAVRRPPERE